MEAITEAVLAVAASPWVYPLVFALTVLDAFLVVVPSETVIVAVGVGLAVDRVGAAITVHRERRGAKTID